VDVPVERGSHCRREGTQLRLLKVSCFPIFQPAVVTRSLQARYVPTSFEIHSYSHYRREAASGNYLLSPGSSSSASSEGAYFRALLIPRARVRGIAWRQSVLESSPEQSAEPTLLSTSSNSPMQTPRGYSDHRQDRRPKSKIVRTRDIDASIPQCTSARSPTSTSLSSWLLK